MSEEEVIAKALKSVQSSKHVTLRHKLDEDSAGEEALWVWVILDDKVVEDPVKFHSTATGVREAIQSELKRQGVARWPYIRFRSASEDREVPAAS
jgi:hypothetical protein